jgi:hypothetical protein
LHLSVIGSAGPEHQLGDRAACRLHTVNQTVTANDGTNASVLDREIVVLSRSKKACEAGGRRPARVSMPRSFGDRDEIQSSFGLTDW